MRWGDAGPFGIIPVWVLEADISDRAARVYGILARYAGAEGSSTWQGKNKLAETMRCSRTSIDRAISELTAIGAVTYEERYAKNGAQLENGYVVHACPSPPPSEAHPLPTGGPPTRASSLPREPSTKLEPSREPRARERWKVDRRQVSPEHDVMAHSVLAAWNEAATQQLASREWLGKIVLRIREHPDFTLDDHRYIIWAALRPENVWWKGPPTPSVVYGNGAQFERAVVTARQQPQGADGAFAVALQALDQMEER